MSCHVMSCHVMSCHVMSCMYVCMYVCIFILQIPFGENERDKTIKLEPTIVRESCVPLQTLQGLPSLQPRLPYVKHGRVPAKNEEIFHYSSITLPYSSIIFAIFFHFFQVVFLSKCSSFFRSNPTSKK